MLIIDPSAIIIRDDIIVYMPRRVEMGEKKK